MDKVSSLLGLSGSASITINLAPTKSRKVFSCRDQHNHRVKLPIYKEQDQVRGDVVIKLKDTKRFEHLGVKIEMIGHLEIFSDNNLCTDFMTMAKQLEPAGTITSDSSFPFKFNKFDKQHETFNGLAGRVQYFLRATILRSYNTNIVQQLDFAVQIPTPEAQKDNNVPIKMEVGIEDRLHILFTYNKTHYHLKDCLEGEVRFQVVKLNIVSMELTLTRKQTFGNTLLVKTEVDTLIKYEVMDGCPVKGEVIPIRMYMQGVALTPSYKNINNRLSVSHFLNLVLIDGEGRKYFKSHEITLYRKK